MFEPHVDQTEQARIAELESYAILDSLTEKEYEDITLLASLICDVPIALISFVDVERQWFKSHRGLSVSETPRAQSFCAHAIQNPSEVFVVTDSRSDFRFLDNPLVTGDPNIVFYAGVPLTTPSGLGLGTVCVIDQKPRVLSTDQKAGLQILAESVMKQLEARREIISLRKNNMDAAHRIKDLDSFAMVVAHDIRSPLSSIQLSNQILKRDYGTKIDNDGLAPQGLRPSLLIEQRM